MKSKQQIDRQILIVPLVIIVFLSILFISMPYESLGALTVMRSFLGDDIGVYYILLGMGVFCTTIYIAFSKYGNIKLGNDEKPEYDSFAWGAMIFTSTMAADIIFYSLCEWALYAGDDYVASLGPMQVWAPTFPLFHWGPVAWSFYIILAVALGFMLHVRGTTKQKFSEACRPLLGSRTDGSVGKIIDLFAIFALLAGAATTFSLATPLLSAALAEVLGITPTVILTIIILIVVAIIYTVTVLMGMKGISGLAKFSVYLFFVLLLYVLIGGGQTRYIIETGVASLGNLTQNFIVLSTWTDPLRQDSFPQNWTIFYWAYWLVYCVATPFFIGMISKGRTIKNTIIGAYGWGLAGTFMSFIILGNYGLSKQMSGEFDMVGYIAAGEPIADTIVRLFGTLPFPQIGLWLLVVNMIIFYSTTFDAITMVVSGYSYKELRAGEEPGKKIRAFWSVLFVLLPIALIFSESTLNNLQSVAIVAAFPIGIILLVIIVGFFKDAKKHIA